MVTIAETHGLCQVVLMGALSPPQVQLIQAGVSQVRLILSYRQALPSLLCLARYPLMDALQGVLALLYTHNLWELYRQNRTEEMRSRLIFHPACSQAHQSP